MDLHHVGIATRDGDEVADLFGSLFDARTVHEERIEGMTVRYLEFGDDYLELLEPHEDGPIDRFLDSNGPGIHHLALATDDVPGALASARDLGVECIDDEPRGGAWGKEVAFLHPRSTGGVLFEFVSTRAERDR